MSEASTSFSPSYTITLRINVPNQPGMLGKIATTIGNAGANIGAVDIVDANSSVLVRDVTVDVRDEAHGNVVVEQVEKMSGVEVVHVADKVFLLHLGGKIEVMAKEAIKTRESLSRAYTPGVARVCTAIAEDPKKAFTLTIKSNAIAVVTDGTAVLGLGDIGPEAAMPVMEGKAMLFKDFGGVDAFPLCLDTKDPDEIVMIVKAIAPTFGGINLEDISAPRCFEIEERLRNSLDIPVFHDDQHGTAVVVLSAVINAAKVVGKKLSEMKAIVVGAGAAGLACTKILQGAGVSDIIVCDREGSLHEGRADINDSVKKWFVENTNANNLAVDVVQAAKGADLFLGVSGPNSFPEEALKNMANDAIVFALANPTPEIDPVVAARHARIIATGRSDYPNQINNVLCFPGIFRGALDVRAREINEEMKLAAAKAIADSISADEVCEEYIIPSVFNRQVVPAVADAVARAAVESGVARRKRPMKDRGDGG